jgi:hypothetical protein
VKKTCERELKGDCFQIIYVIKYMLKTFNKSGYIITSKLVYT